MTSIVFKPDITADKISDAQPNVRSSFQHLLVDAFVHTPAAPKAAVVCEPFSNDTPPPSGQTMREPPEDCAPKRPTLHLPSTPQDEANTSVRQNRSAR